MRTEDYNHITYDFRLGKCGLSLRTWLLLNNEENRKYVYDMLDDGRYMMDDSDSEIGQNIDYFNEIYNHRCTTLDGMRYNGLNSMLCLAAGENNFTLVNKFIEMGADAFDHALEVAVGERHIDMVKFLIEKGATEKDNSITEALRVGNIEIIRLLLNTFKYMPDDIEECMFAAIRDNNFDIVKLLIKYGANDFYEYLDYAVEIDKTEMIVYFKQFVG